MMNKICRRCQESESGRVTHRRAHLSKVIRSAAEGSISANPKRRISSSTHTLTKFLVSCHIDQAGYRRRMKAAKLTPLKSTSTTVPNFLICTGISQSFSLHARDGSRSRQTANKEHHYSSKSLSTDPTSRSKNSSKRLGSLVCASRYSTPLCKYCLTTGYCIQASRAAFTLRSWFFSFEPSNIRSPTGSIPSVSRSKKVEDRPSAQARSLQQIVTKTGGAELAICNVGTMIEEAEVISSVERLLHKEEIGVARSLYTGAGANVMGRKMQGRLFRYDRANSVQTIPELPYILRPSFEKYPDSSDIR